MELAEEIWISVRPYLVKMITDFIVAALLWILLWAFKGITSLFVVEGWAGDFIKNIHSMSAILAFSAFAIMFFCDIIKIHREKEGGY